MKGRIADKRQELFLLSLALLSLHPPTPHPPTPHPLTPHPAIVHNIDCRTQEKKIQFQEKVDLMKGRIADKRQELFHKWEEKSREFIGNFMDLFSRDGRLVGQRRINLYYKYP